MKIKFLIILGLFIFGLPLQLVYAPPPPDHKRAFDYSEHVIIGKILSMEILSEPYVQITENTGSTIAGVALYEIQVEKYLKNPLDTNIIKVPGYYVGKEHVRSGFDLLYDVDQRVFLYIQPNSHNTLDGHDLIIRSYESRSLDVMGSICGESDTFYHKGECKEIPDCSSNTIFVDGVCNIVDGVCYIVDGGCDPDVDGNTFWCGLQYNYLKIIMSNPLVFLIVFVIPFTIIGIIIGVIIWRKRK